MTPARLRVQVTPGMFAAERTVTFAVGDTHVP